MRRARGHANQLGNRANQLRLSIILGTDSTRSFYFAVQQLFVVDERWKNSQQGAAGVSRQQYRIPAMSAKAERHL
jgi:hypothetical protein